MCLNHNPQYCGNENYQDEFYFEDDQKYKQIQYKASPAGMVGSQGQILITKDSPEDVHILVQGDPINWETHPEESKISIVLTNDQGLNVEFRLDYEEILRDENSDDEVLIEDEEDEFWFWC